MIQHKRCQHFGSALLIRLAVVSSLCNLVHAECSALSSCYSLKSSGACSQQFGCEWNADILRTEFGTSYIYTCESPSYKVKCGSYDENQSKCSAESSCEWTSSGGGGSSSTRSSGGGGGRSGVANFFLALFVIALIAGAGAGASYFLWQQKKIGPWPHISKFFSQCRSCTSEHNKKEAEGDEETPEPAADASTVKSHSATNQKLEEVEAKGEVQVAEAEKNPMNDDASSSSVTVIKTYGADGSITVVTKTTHPNGSTEEKTQMFPNAETAALHGVQ